MEAIKELTAEVVYKEGPSAKAPVLTTIRIHLGKFLVAERTVGGRYSQRQALAEFARNPKMFQHFPAYETAKAMKLAA